MCEKLTRSIFLLLFPPVPPHHACLSVYPPKADDEEGGLEAGGDEVVLNGWGAGAERTEEDGEAEDEFEALLSKTMSESVEKTKIARTTTQVCLSGRPAAS